MSMRRTISRVGHTKKGLKPVISDKWLTHKAHQSSYYEYDIIRWVVLQTLMKSEEPMCPVNIAKVLPYSTNSVMRALSELTYMGFTHQIGNGTYGATDNAKDVQFYAYRWL